MPADKPGQRPQLRSGERACGVQPLKAERTTWFIPPEDRMNLFCFWWFFRRRVDELGVVDRNVLLHVGDLDCEASTRTCQGPAVRNLHAVRVAIVRIVDLRGHASQRGLAIADQAQEKSSLLVKLQLDGRLA